MTPGEAFALGEAVTGQNVVGDAGSDQWARDGYDQYLRPCRVGFAEPCYQDRRWEMWNQLFLHAFAACADGAKAIVMADEAMLLRDERVAGLPWRNGYAPRTVKP